MNYKDETGYHGDVFFAHNSRHNLLHEGAHVADVQKNEQIELVTLPFMC